MKRSEFLLLGVAISAACLLSTPSAYADSQRDVDLKLTIDGIHCTADQVYDIVPSYIVNPEDCDREEVRARINTELPIILPQPSSSCAAEVLGTCDARDLSVDTPKPKPVDPVVQTSAAAVAVGLGLIIVVDQVILNGVIGRTVVQGGSRLVAFLKAALRM